MNAGFWNGKRVFLTGHTGFKGSWLSLWLQRLGAQVTGYALKPPTAPNLFTEGNVADGLTSLHGDIRDFQALEEALLVSEAEIVLHMAAQPLVRRSYADPVETYSTNVMGTVNVLEAVRRAPSVRVLVNVTTDKCYENREWVWPYREDEPMGGADPYSSSKGCSELVTAAYRASFFGSRTAHSGAAVATARAGNVIGGGDWALDRLFPDILRAFSAGETVRIRNPKAIRPWQHVLEPLRGYLSLAEHLWSGGREYAEAWNFGPNVSDAKPVEWIVAAMADRWRRGARWELDASAHPHEAQFLKLDISKVGARLGWQPAMSLEQALDLTVTWHAAFVAGADVRQLTLRQIAEYQLTIA